MDRRVLTAILLMMAIAIVPSFFLKPPATPAVADSTTAAAPAAPSPTMSAAAPTVADSAAAPTDTTTTVAPQDTVEVRTPLATYGIATRGAAIARASITNYPSLVATDSGRPAQLVHPGSPLLVGTVIAGRDSLQLAGWDFVPSAEALDVTTGAQALTLTGTRNGVTVAITYTFRADDYGYDVAGTVTGLPGNLGGTLLLDLGTGIAPTEADVAGNAQAAGLVTKALGQDAERHDFSSFDPGESKQVDGQFEWLALKGKYFVSAVFAFDSTAGRFAGARLAATSPAEPVTEARAVTSLPISADGRFAFGAWLGPMEYKRLKLVGHDFDDVNPYGWPGFRGMIRFFSEPVRWLLLKMHDVGISWGLALVLFGVGIRLLLWPLNQKAMRSSIAMQAIQPEIQRLQAQYKNDPQKLSQKQMELFREHKVNPLGGCLPMLLPWPVMLALFFVFQNTIELRGAPFLWLPDLSLKDPFYVVPVLMGVSMFGMMKIGQIGMPPNDQQKLMTWMMPVMMTVMFATFASGLNLYYTVQNLVGIPQQWLLMQERKQRAGQPVVKTKPKS